MDKLNIIKNSIEQIRTAIGEPCDHIENLPEKINELVEDASKVGYSTVFVFSSEENPNKPTGNQYENGIVSDLDDNWSQTKIEDSAKVWMSFSLFKQSGGQVSDWVTPILITGKGGKDAFTPKFKIEDGFWYAQYSENGEWVKVGQATGADGKDGIQGPAGADGANGQDGTDGEPGRGIASIEKLFAVNNDPNNHPEPDGEWLPAEQVSTSSTNRYMWCKETMIYTDGPEDPIYYIVAIEGEPGATGTGNDAPIIYPAGIWSSEKEYESTDNKVPYVYYLSVDENGNPKEESGYYVLKSNLGDYVSSTPPNSDVNWEKMESFNSIYSDIGIFNQALVGSAVFYKDYMFSQHGTTTLSGTTMTADYEKFNVEDPFVEGNVFYPNVCFNLKTGETWIGKTKFHVDENGDVTLGGFSVSNRSLWIGEAPDRSDTDEGSQFLIDKKLGIRIGTYNNLLRYVGIGTDGTAYFSNGKVRFNNDGSGFLGADTEEEAIISWTDSKVRIGKGESASIYNLTNGVVSNQINTSNTKYYSETVNGNAANINDVIGYDHDFYLNDEDTSIFTLNFKVTVSNLDLPANGYCGTFIFSNVTNSDKDIIINGAINTSKYSLINSLAVPAGECHMYRLYLYGYSIWKIIKVS